MATPGKILSRTSTRKYPSAPNLSSQSPDKKVLSKNAETAHCCSYISQLSITETESAKTFWKRKRKTSNWTHFNWGKGCVVIFSSWVRSRPDRGQRRWQKYPLPYFFWKKLLQRRCYRYMILSSLSLVFVFLSPAWPSLIKLPEQLKKYIFLFSFFNFFSSLFGSSWVE